MSPAEEVPQFLDIWVQAPSQSKMSLQPAAGKPFLGPQGHDSGGQQTVG